jgi:hypothetical protein
VLVVAGCFSAEQNASRAFVSDQSGKSAVVI